MSRMSEHHQKLDKHGVGRCSVPMWQGGSPSGFCDEFAFGERPYSPERYSYCTGEYMRDDCRYNGYVPGLACPGHGGPSPKTYKDGSAWCAVTPAFVNLQESPAGFGDTIHEAIRALEKELRRPQP